MTEPAMPKDAWVLTELPVLGTGKRDHVQLGRMADAAALAA